jgi:hypothetical protein
MLPQIKNSVGLPHVKNLLLPSVVHFFFLGYHSHVHDDYHDHGIHHHDHGLLK